VRGEIDVKRDERIASLMIWILNQRQERRCVQEEKEGSTASNEFIWAEDPADGSKSLLAKG
jgi:fructose-1,6-bisphosphatase/inositol monophosphatase family enzyme